MTQQQIPNPIELYEAVSQGFAQAIRGVKADQMSNATPCTEWNVQALLNHNINVAGTFHRLLTAGPQVEALELSGPLPPEGPLAAFEAGAARVLEAAKSPGKLEEELDTPFGRMPAGQLLMFPFMDLLLHRWDLTSGTTQTNTMDSGLAEVCFNIFEPMADGLRPRGIFGASVTVPSGSNFQDKLLGLTGRNP